MARGMEQAALQGARPCPEGKETRMKRSATLYNIIMPVWLLLGFIPYLWPVVLLGASNRCRIV